MAVVHNMVVGLNKGHKVTKNTVAPRHARARGQSTKKNEFVKQTVREVMGFAPYERRALELLRVSKGKILIIYWVSRKSFLLKSNTNFETANFIIWFQIRDAFDSWRSDWALTSVPRESEKKCLESSNNKERLPLLESTKYLLLLFNREKIFTSPQKTSHFIIQSSITSQSEIIFCWV